jgi:hypothetical protein
VFNHVELEAMARHRREEAYREAEARQRVRQAKRQPDCRDTHRSSMTRSSARWQMLWERTERSWLQRFRAWIGTIAAGDASSLGHSA